MGVEAKGNNQMPVSYYSRPVSQSKLFAFALQLGSPLNPLNRDVISPAFLQIAYPPLALLRLFANMK
jgi:hypothetical protein